MPNHVTNIVSFSGDKSRISAMLKEIQNDEHGIGSVDFEKILPMPDTVYNGSLGIRERELYGENNWYDWRIGNWGTKWNSYGYTENTSFQDGKIKFLTAWSAPHPILQKLSEMYPDVKMEHEWADEDIGMNCGRYVYYDSERVEEYFPESQKECLEFAAKVMDVSLEEDYSLYLNASETGYVNIEYDDEYELVEIEDLPALFTNERITDADIPKGMYCYHIRHDDNCHYSNTRYHALNLHSFFQHGHYEIRCCNASLHAGEVRAQIVLALAISNAAMTKKYCSPSVSHSDNMRYSFRVWLLNLGLIGDEFKNCRTHLLKHLDGNIAWRHPEDAIAQRERLKQKRIAEREQRISAIARDTTENTITPVEPVEAAVSNPESCQREEPELEDIGIEMAM